MEHSSGAKKFLQYLIPFEIATKEHDIKLKLYLRAQGFVSRFWAPGPLKSHPALNTISQNNKISKNIEFSFLRGGGVPPFGPLKSEAS